MKIAFLRTHISTKTAAFVFGLTTSIPLLLHPEIAFSSGKIVGYAFMVITLTILFVIVRGSQNDRPDLELEVAVHFLYGFLPALLISIFVCRHLY